VLETPAPSNHSVVEVAPAERQQWVLAVWKRGDARAREKKRSFKLPLGGKKFASKSDLNRPKKNHSRCFFNFMRFYTA
jgi:hypothetical protein